MITGLIPTILLSIGMFFSAMADAYDALDDALWHAKSGMDMQSYRIEIIAQNIANEQSTALTPDANPYQRKMVFFADRYDPVRQKSRVQLVQQTHDDAPFPQQFDPSHPAADDRGMVKMPNVNKYLEMADAKEAELGFETCLQTYQAAKQMQYKVIDLLQP